MTDTQPLPAPDTERTTAMSRSLRVVLICTLIVGGLLETYSHLDGHSAYLSEFASFVGQFLMAASILWFVMKAGAGRFVIACMVVASASVVGAQTARLLAHTPTADGAMLLDSGSDTYDTVVSMLDPIPPAAMILGFFALILRMSDRHQLLLRRTEEIRAMQAEKDALQRRILQSQKLESLGVLTGGVAHDFNNYLMGILGVAEVAMHDIPASSRNHESLRLIHETAEKAAGVTQQLLAFGGAEPAFMQPLDINSLGKGLAGLLGVTVPKKVSLDWDLTDSAIVIDADETQIHQIIVNLVSNGTDAIRGAGAITVKTQKVHLDDSDLQSFLLGDLCSEGDFGCVSVSDTGTGVDERVADRIFDPFFTTKTSGRGMGLAVVMGIVRSHNGAIAFEERSEGGTLFRVVFPLSHKTIRPAKPVATPIRAAQSSGTVLVVDDEPHVRDATRAMCEHLGYAVVTANDGKEALELLEDRHKTFSVALIDIVMPRMNGVVTLQEIRSRGISLPILMMTGFGGDAENELEEGTEILRKPFSVATLKTAITELLAE